jgi:hypothetical protein
VPLPVLYTTATVLRQALLLPRQASIRLLLSPSHRSNKVNFPLPSVAHNFRHFNTETVVNQALVLAVHQKLSLGAWVRTTGLRRQLLSRS